MSMKARPSFWRRLLGGQAGHGLVDLLVAAGVGVVVVGAAFSMYLASTRNEATTASRADVVSQAEAAMERMTRELRQGSSVVVSSANSVTFETYVRGLGARRVRYTCVVSTCTRAVAPSGTNTFGTAAQFLAGITNSNVFTVTGRRVEISLRTSLTDTRSNRTLKASLDDGVTLRNSP